MATLLVFTVGRSDLQLVDGEYRKELFSKKCGELHDEIERREWQLQDSPPKESGDVTELPIGKLKLCTPKLDAVLRFFQKDELPTKALILETRRTLPDDPRFAGTVLEQRLRERDICVRREAFLEGNTKLEDLSKPVDAVVRQDVVNRLSDIIASTIENMKPERIFVATTGGLPAAYAVIKELVRLHAVDGSKVTSLEVPDGMRTGQNDLAIEEKFHPDAGYRARWHALTLIMKGNLLGAWGAVSHLENGIEQEWIKVIKWLANFAASLPNKDCEIDVLKHPCMAVRAALRVEFALRAGDIPRAVHGTVAFFEAALWDHLLEHFEQAPNNHRCLKLQEGKTAPVGEKLLRDGKDIKDDKSRPFEHKECAEQPDIQWFLFHESGAGRFARDYLHNKPLKSLSDVIEKVKGFRNDVAHNEPTPEMMATARRGMQEEKLWSDKDTFLSQPLIQNVLKELGVCEPERLLDDLLAEIRQWLVKPNPS